LGRCRCLIDALRITCSARAFWTPALNTAKAVSRHRHRVAPTPISPVHYEDLIALNRRWLALLPRETAEKIAYRNAARLFGRDIPPRRPGVE